LTGGFCGGTKPSIFPFFVYNAALPYTAFGNFVSPECGITFGKLDALGNNAAPATWCNDGDRTRQRHFTEFQQDMYAAKLHSDGTWAWRLGAGGGLADVGTDVSVVTPLGTTSSTDAAILVSGTIRGAGQVGDIQIFDHFPDDIFIDPSGQLGN